MGKVYIRGTHQQMTQYILPATAVLYTISNIMFATMAQQYSSKGTSKAHFLDYCQQVNVRV